MSLKPVIALLDGQVVALAAKLQGCADAAAAVRKTLDEAEGNSLRHEFDYLLAALPGAVDTGRLLGRMEATVHLLKIVEERGAEALAAEFEKDETKTSRH